MTGPKVTDELIADLAADGEHVDTGVFTLDPAEARAKLREYQLSDRHGYVLLLVEAAQLAGRGLAPNEDGGPAEDAGKIVFELGGETRARFAAPGLRAEALAEALVAVFGEDKDGAETDEGAARRARVLRYLGLAINAMLSLDDVELWFALVDADGAGQRVVFDDEGRATIEAAPNELEPGELRLSLRTGFANLAPTGARAEAEAELLRERCRYSSAPVIVDERYVGDGLESALWSPEGTPYTPRTKLELDGEPIGRAAWRGDEDEAELLIVTRGVFSERVPLPAAPKGFRAIVEADLRKDLSQAKIMRDDRFDAIVAAAERCAADFVHLRPESAPEPDPAIEAARREEQRKQRNLLVVGAAVGLSTLLALFVSGQESGEAPGDAEPQLDQHELALERQCETDMQGCIDLGYLRLVNNRPAEAIAPLRRACEAGHSVACTGLAEAMVGTGQLDEALRLFDARCDDDDTTSCILASKVRMEHGEALRAMRPGYPRPKFEIGPTVFSEQGERARVEVVSASALELELTLKDEHELVVATLVSVADPDIPALERSRAMLVGQALHPAPRDALVLGLADAGFMRALVALEPKLALTVVEPEPRVEEAARLHFNVWRERGRIEPDDATVLDIVLEQPAAYLEREQADHDLIYLHSSLAMTAAPSPALDSPELLARLRDRLAPGGALVLDCKAAELDDRLAALRPLFPTIQTLRAGGDVVIFASRARAASMPRERRARCEALDAEITDHQRHLGTAPSEPFSFCALADAVVSVPG